MFPSLKESFKLSEKSDQSKMLEKLNRIWCDDNSDMEAPAEEIDGQEDGPKGIFEEIREQGGLQEFKKRLKRARKYANEHTHPAEWLARQIVKCFPELEIPPIVSDPSDKPDRTNETEAVKKRRARKKNKKKKPGKG